MRNFSAGLQSALESSSTIIGTYTKVTRTDGEVTRFVDLDEDSYFDGELYFAAGGSERTAVEISVGLGADNVDLRGLFDEDLWDEDELLSGAFNYARIEIFLGVHGDASLEKIPMMLGHFGEIEYDAGVYRIKVNCYNYGFSRNIGASTSPVCRDRLGGPRCKKDLAALQTSCTILEVISGTTFRLSVSAAQSHVQGLLGLTSGAAIGAEMEIKHVSGDTVTTYLPFAVLPAAGDSALLTPGCPGTREACKNTFNNLLNFDGEPDLPGQDEIFSPTIRRAN